MGYQFFHVESYARTSGKGKAGGHTVASVMAEATRQPDACPHVENPVPPVLLFGRPLAEVEAEANNWAANSVDSIGRKLRKDGLCLLGGVISAPDDMDAKDWEAMKADAIAWLNRDGRLVSVAEHTDEAHRHIHFYKIPAAGERFEVLHPGRAAAAVAKAKGMVKGAQNQAYKKAMRGLQDDFFEQVGARYGLTRLGPGKRRLDRSGWNAEQAAAIAAAKAMKMAGEATHEMEKAKADAQEIATKAKADADKAQAEIEKLEKTRKSNVLFVKNWKKEKAAIEVKLDRLGTLGGQIGAFIGRAADAVLGVFTGRKAREERQKQALSEVARDLKKAKDQIEEEKGKAARARLERDAAVIEARKELKTLAAERDAAQDLNRINSQATGIRQVPKMRH